MSAQEATLQVIPDQGGLNRPTKRLAKNSNLVVFVPPSTVRPLDRQDGSIVSFVRRPELAENLRRDLHDR